jgi:hypothetical protein
MAQTRNIGKEVIAGLTEFVIAGERDLELNAESNVHKDPFVPCGAQAAPDVDEVRGTDTDNR